jgi:hypothetical protein
MAEDLPSESKGHPSPRKVLDEMHDHQAEYLAGSKPRLNLIPIRTRDRARVSSGIPHQTAESKA